ncbi:MAG: O-antigen ligase family protein [Candidatus Yonathbacteria bacterium]|nr:O-antigen ligase family protein [Candidatus Yonathbacteria bacterium]
MNANKFLQWLILGGLFLVLFLPLYVSDSMFFPFITGKNFAFRIIVELITGAWIILALRDAAYRPKKSLILYALGAFVGVMAVADILSENPFKSFWSNYERMEGFVALIHFFGYFLVVSSVLAATNLWERFWQTSLGVNAILIGYGAMQLIGKLDIHQGSTRIDATFGNATYFAAYLLFHIFIAAFLAVRHKGVSWVRWLYGVIIFVDLFMLYHTATRGAILGLLGGAILAAILIALFEKGNLMLRKWAIGILVIAILVPVLVLSFRGTAWVKESPVLSRFTSISLQETTTKSRFMVWNMALQGFKERPVFGWGQESFNFVFNKYYDPKMYDQEPWFDRAHNVFFDWLIAGGLLGLLAYLSLFGMALYYLWRKTVSSFSVAEKSIFTGLFAGYFFNNLFVFDNLTSYIFFFSVLAYLHSVYGTSWHVEQIPVKGKTNNAPKRENENMQPDVIFSPIVIIATIFVLYFANYHPIAANLDLIGALQKQSDLGVNLTYFKKAIAHDSLGTSETREQLTMAASRILSTNADQKVKNDFVTTAMSELEKQIAHAPQDARYQIFMGSFLNQIGNYDQALQYLKNTQALTPKKQQVYFEMTSAFLNKKDYKSAVDAAKIAYELEPNYDDARSAYVMTLIYSGDKAKADEIAKPLRERSILDPQSAERLLKAYIDTKDYKNAEGILNTLIASDPSNYRYHISLAGLYLEKGERQKAVMEIQKAIDVNPEFKDQGEYYIKEIKAGRNP